MTDDLHTLTRKRLAALARSRHVSGWHEMRKADLIKALKSQPAENDPSAFPATFPIQHEAGSPTNGWHSNRPGGNTPRRARLNARPLLPSDDRDTDHFAAQPVNPHWVRAGWRLSHRTLRQTLAALGVAAHQAEPVLRLYEVSSDERLTHSVTFVSDTRVAADAHEWFVEIDRPGGIYQLHLGILTSAGEFHRLVSSDRIDMSQTQALPLSPLSRQPSPARPAANGHTPADRTRVIPLSVEAELTIRGITHPRAVMSVGAESLPVEEDGSFEYRRPLADGRHVIPTTAHSPDGRRQHTIVIALECNTKHLTPLEPDDE